MTFLGTTVGYDLKIKILKFIESKKFTRIEIMNMFKMSKKTFYKIKNDFQLRENNKCSYKKSHKRTTKITDSIKKFIIKYVTSKVIFDYKKLICIINKKYNVSISKSSIYGILKNHNITKKNVQ